MLIRIKKQNYKRSIWFRLVIIVLKILTAAMENVDGESGAGPSTSAGNESNEEFFNTGRVGRRNALPDILSSHATVSTADLPDQLSALTTTDKNVPSTSGGSNVGISSEVKPTASTSQISTTTTSSWKHSLTYLN